MSEAAINAADLPASWVLTTLGTVVQYGRTEKAEPNEIADDDWVLELEDIEKDSSRLLQKVTFLQRQSKSTKNRFQPGDVLYGKLRPYLNKVLIADEPGYCTTEILPLKAGAHLDNGYLFYWLKHPTFLKYVEAESHGMNMPRLGTEAGKAAPFVLAPRNEQTRIANQLDTLLTRIQSCNDRFDAIPGLLKRFRQTVLDVATAGQLTADWRAGGGIERWEYLRAKDVCEKVQSGGTPKEGFTEQGVPFLKVYNIVNQRVAFDYKPQYISKENHARSMSKSQTRPGDVLMNIVGPPLGKVAIVPDAHPTWNINQALTLFRPSNRITTGWLYYVLCGGSNIAEIEHEIRGSAGQVNISLSQCRDFVFPVPPIAEQTEIVRRVEALFALADRVETRAKAARIQAQRLGPLLLAKAFRGELVLQDPQDESAIDLLNHIAAAHSPAPKKRIAKAAARGRSKVKAQDEGTRWNGEETLGAIMKLELVPENYLETLIAAADGVNAKELWQKSKLDIDDFYVQLSKEIDSGHIAINAHDESKISRSSKIQRG
jgi:type I restriction enzyme S subunit